MIPRKEETLLETISEAGIWLTTSERSYKRGILSTKNSGLNASSWRQTSKVGSNCTANDPGFPFKKTDNSQPQKGSGNDVVSNLPSMITAPTKSWAISASTSSIEDTNRIKTATYRSASYFLQDPIKSSPEPAQIRHPILPYQTQRPKTSSSNSSSSVLQLLSRNPTIIKTSPLAPSRTDDLFSMKAADRAKHRPHFKNTQFLTFFHGGAPYSIAER